MNRMNRLSLSLAVVTLLSSGVAQAALHDRGGGLLYDDVLNITWLQDANYAKTSGFNADGRMAWYEAKAWAENLVFHDSARNLAYDDWRLPSVTPLNETWNDQMSTDGSSDTGFNITSPNSELSYMYYANLGLKGYYSPDGNVNADFGVFGNGSRGGQNNVGLVKNLQSYVYWSGTEYYEGDPGYYDWENPHTSPTAWSFNTSDGYQHFESRNILRNVWAVRSGDVPAVPEPESYALLLAGLGLLGGVAKRQRRTLSAS